jgi:hypothetical protein
MSNVQCPMSSPVEFSAKSDDKSGLWMQNATTNPSQSTYTQIHTLTPPTPAHPSRANPLLSTQICITQRMKAGGTYVTPQILIHRHDLPNRASDRTAGQSEPPPTCPNSARPLRSQVPRGSALRHAVGLPSPSRTQWGFGSMLFAGLRVPRPVLPRNDGDNCPSILCDWDCKCYGWIDIPTEPISLCWHLLISAANQPAFQPHVCRPAVLPRTTVDLAGTISIVQHWFAND